MISFPWDSRVTGFGDNGYPIYDRTYGAEQLRDVYQTFFSNGVFMQAGDPSFKVGAGEGMSVNVQPGRCNIQGTIGVEKTVRNLVLQAASSADRIDTVVLRWDTDLDVRSIDLYVKQGTAAASPRAPELTRTDLMWELGLANVYVTANSTSVSASRITDTRLDSDRCGIVTPFTSIDTTTFYEQIQTAITERLGEINDSAAGAMTELENQTQLAVQVSKDAIDGTTAGNLSNRLTAVETDKADKTDVDAAVQRLQDGKVNRVGDTMTGDLAIVKGDGCSFILGDENDNANNRGYKALQIYRTDNNRTASNDLPQRMTLGLSTDGAANLATGYWVENDAGVRTWNLDNSINLGKTSTTLTKPLAINSGGTGASTRKDGFNGLAYLGTNPTTSAANDTMAFWHNLGTGYALYNAIDRLQGQPSQWGYLVNYAWNTEIHQVFYSQAGTQSIYHRKANSSTTTMPGWYQVYDSNNKSLINTPDFVDKYFSKTVNMVAGGNYWQISMETPSGYKFVAIRGITIGPIATGINYLIPVNESRYDLHFYNHGSAQNNVGINLFATFARTTSYA